MRVSKPGQSVFEKKRQIRRKEKLSRQDRLHKHVDKLEMYRALKATYEQLGQFDEVRRLSTRIRTVEQQIRYMGVPDEEVLYDPR